MKRIFTIANVVLLLLVGCNESRRGNDSNRGEDSNEAAAESNQDKFAGKTQRDASFVFEVVESNYAEIKLAELGNQRSRKPEVKRMAQMLLTDHTTSLNDLKTLAQAKAISVPVQEADGARRNLENMAEEADEDFDKSWCKEMLDMHEATIGKFENRFKDTEDAELKAYIEKTLPVLRKHRESLEALDENLKRSNS